MFICTRSGIEFFMSHKRVIPQMFDVRPTDASGDLDWRKIGTVGHLDEQSLDYGESATQFRAANDFLLQEPNTAPQLESKAVPDDFWVVTPPREALNWIEPPRKEQEEPWAPSSDWRSEPYFPKKRAHFSFPWDAIRPSFSFLFVALLLVLAISGMVLYGKGTGIRGEVLGVSQDGFSNLTAAATLLKGRNFKTAALEMDQAYVRFSEASSDLEEIGSTLIGVSRYIPFASKLASGKDAIEAGKHFSLAGKALVASVEAITKIENPLSGGATGNVSILNVYRATEKNLQVAKDELEAASALVARINVEDLPSDKQLKFITVKKNLPSITNGINNFLNNGHVFTDLLGGNGPRKYLFLFQNNQEMRATGGFIGSYGLLNISSGRIRNLTIDGIFNPDGQLSAKIVPPRPIQKMSAAWSLHDSNWFPDFPTSARKAMDFFEKTGGPTVDGVITLTPTVMEKLLGVTGPIEMPEYGVTLSQDNFIEATQYEVELDYDKQQNRPKQILADLAPLLLDRIFNAKSFNLIGNAVAVLSQGLAEKQILMYSSNSEVQKLIVEQGWSGEILRSSSDYLSVINTNINGFKTDGVVTETIRHKASIGKDGSVIDTVTVTRQHNGGKTGYEWWDKVNADYLRVYVPQGSELMKAEGQTREFTEPALNYDMLGFERDPLIEQEERGTMIDEQSGTRIYTEAEKTVFANWVYVSPQESVTLQYTYRLPFKVAPKANEQMADSYALLVQKQSGSVGSAFNSQVVYPKEYQLVGNYPDDLKKNDHAVEYSIDLKTDQFFGMTFIKE